MEIVEAFADRNTMRGRCPADDLADRVFFPSSAFSSVS
jgi:hypothetical protein